MIKRIFVCFPLVMLLVVACSGRSEDKNQSELREGTVVITGPQLSELPDYEFIKADSNHIDMNGDDWSELRIKLAMADATPVNIVHIGDSHIQADVATDRVRRLMQQRYGDGGRGLVTPLKIAGTNEPWNYIFTTDSRYTSAKLLKLPWMTDMGFTGVSFSPNSNAFSITLSTVVKKNPEGDPFNGLTIFSDGRVLVERITNGDNVRVNFNDSVMDYMTEVSLASPQTTVTLQMRTFESITIFGVSLLNEKGGVRYHAIGNNGATYSAYNRLMSMGSDVNMLDPDLIIISLGTNEAFGKVTDEALYSEIDYMVRDLRKNNPDAKFLLVTPMECQRAQRTSARKTRKGRRSTVYSKSYSVNENVKRLRNVIVKYGKNNSIPVYDWYEVAGGNGASTQWLDNGLMNTDRIHNTFTGYELQGNMLYNALESALNPSN
ncbi:MAG: hypothetical protein K2O00_07070 [Muribaculaceae bacterium]|nr:hypothetical protein [Muribaculaceae bacterium]